MIDNKDFNEEEFIKDNKVIRLKSGIQGLDELIEGGFPKGTAVLVMGQPGCGKTIFASQFINEGINKYNDNGLIVLIGQHRNKFLLDVKRFGWDFKGLEKENKLVIREAPPLDINFNLTLLNLLEVVKKNNIKRVMIDSFSLFFSAFKDNLIKRREMMSMIDALTNKGCVVMLTMEKMKKDIRYQEEFAADSIIELNLETIRDKIIRKLKVLKMRRTKIKNAFVPYTILNKGIRVFPKPKLEYPKTISLEKVKTGVIGLDEMSMGGFIKGSTTLLSGSSGTGKTVISMQFIINGAKNKEPGIYVSFEQSKAQLIALAKMFGWEIEPLLKEGLIKLLCDYPENLSPEEHYINITKLIKKVKAERVVIDSSSALYNYFGTEETNELNKNLFAYFKNNGITSIMTENSKTLLGAQAVSESYSNSLADNIVMLKYLELESSVKRSIILLKMRGSNHDKEIREYEITKDGVIIKTKFAGVVSVLTGSAVKVGKTIEEHLKDEFAMQLGPMGIKKFNEMKTSGLTKDNLKAFIDNLVDKEIITTEKAESFKNRVLLILKDESVEGLEEKKEEKKRKRRFW